MSNSLIDLNKASVHITNCFTAYTVYDEGNMSAEDCIQTLMDEIYHINVGITNTKNRLQKFVEMI